MNVQDVLSRLTKVRHEGKGWKACCPAHDDKNPSLSVNEENGKVLLYCQSQKCNYEDIVKALGIEKNGERNGKAEIVKTYDYTDEHGNLLFQVCRFIPKDFRQRKPDPAQPDGWTWSTKGVRKVLYRLQKYRTPLSAACRF